MKNTKSGTGRARRAFAAFLLVMFGGYGIASPVSAQLLSIGAGLGSVTLTSPKSGSTVSGTVTVTATVSGLLVSGVQFKLDGVNLGASDSTSPYSVSWDTATASNGSHTLTAVARDALGLLQYTSNAVTVTVFNDKTPPAVTLTSPAPGSTVSGTVTVSASASDDVGVVGVRFKLDGADLGAEDAVAPFSMSWDTTGVSSASHTLTAVARDAAGNLSTSAPVTVTVSNTAPPSSTRVEETDPAVAYAGTWFHGNTTFAWSGGTASFARGPASQASFTFTGTQVTWIGWRSPQAGIARVFVDGALVAEVDQFSATQAVQEPVFTSAVLAAGSHTLTIEATGTANPSATDTIVVVDAFEVTTGSTAPPPPPSTVTRFQETDPAIVYTTGWQPNTTHAWSDGAAMYSATTGARATFTFTGTAVAWIGLRGHIGGIARVFLDGAFVADVDQYAPDEQVPTVLFTASGLAAGSHALTVEVTGTKNPLATHVNVGIDAFDVTSSSSPGPTTGTHLEETDPRVAYSAGWSQGNTVRAWSGGTAALSATAGAQATLGFSGRSVSWIGFRGPQAGIARVSVDGVFVAEIDMFSTAEEVRAVVFSAANLTDTSHTLTIEATGRKNAASTDAFVVVDAFEVP
jgi:hypothetical protein